jgi:lysophospholipid acyltransferase (LPLAT)-like uncharacterized protein
MKLKTRAISGIGGGLITALMRTTRVEIRGRENWDEWGGARKPAIYVLWHGRLLPCSYFRRHEELATLISQHRDGDYIAGVVEGWWGFQAIRGSSSRGGAGALREMVRTLKSGKALAITPDGPRGPRQKMKPGPVIAAQLTGAPIIPVSAGTDRAWWVEGWDRFLVPKPFSRFQMWFAEPIFVPRDSTPADIEAATLRIETRLNEVTEEVDRPWR